MRIAIAIFITLFCSCPLSGQWLEVDMQNSLEGMQFKELEWADSLNGYIMGRHFGYYLTTSDGGDVWTLDSLIPRPGGIGTRPFEFGGVDFVSPLLGFVAYKVDPLNRRDTLIYVTTDGGESWTEKHVKIKYANKKFSRVRMAQNGSMYIHYTSRLDNGNMSNALDYSNDFGLNWKNLCSDTIETGEETIFLPEEYILVDSLTHYAIMNRNDGGEYYETLVKVSTDGGKDWSFIEDHNHPLSKERLKYANISAIIVDSDTGFTCSIIYPRYNANDYCARTIDINNHLHGPAWFTYSHIYEPAKTKYCLENAESYIVLLQDSIIFLDKHTYEVVRKVALPADGGEMRLSPNGQLWYYTLKRLFRFDHNALSTVGRHIDEKGHALRVSIYPNPIKSDIGFFEVMIEVAEGNGEAHLAICDLCGNIVYSSRIRYNSDGSCLLPIHVNDISAPIPSVGIFLVLVSTQKYSTSTKIIFLQ
jgi:hypothetical protein